MSNVVIGDILPYTQITATGGQTVFSTNWTANYASDVVVYQTPSGDLPDDATQILPYPADYSVAFMGSQQEVQVTLVTGANAGDIITITRQTPADRMNLYSNTNFTPTMLNNDFGILTLVDQQAQLVNQLIGPRYNYSADITDVVDTILPILGENQVWIKNSNNTAIIPYTLPSSGLAPSNSTFITITDETSTLPDSFSLSSLGTGLLVNNPDSENMITTTVIGTANQIVVINGDLSSPNSPIGISLANNPILPGTAGMGVPAGSTAQRVTPTPPNINLRYNTDSHLMEYYNGSIWVGIDTSAATYLQADNNLSDVDDIATSRTNLGFQDINRNLCIGSNFTNNPWQRGTTFPGLQNNLHGIFTADNFAWYDSNGGAIVTVNKTADGPSVGQAGYLIPYCYEVDVTTGQASLGSDDYYVIFHYIYGADFTRIAQVPFTISGWFKAHRAGTYSFGVKNLGEDRSCVQPLTIVSPDTWEYHSVTFPASPAAGSWNYGNDIGIYVMISLGLGSDWIITPGSWQATNADGVTSQINGVQDNTDNFRFCELQIEKGSVATPFAIEPIATTWDKCKTLFQKSYTISVDPATITDVGATFFQTSSTIADSEVITVQQLRIGNLLHDPNSVHQPIVIYSNVTGNPGFVYNSVTASDVAVTTTNAGDGSFGIVNDSGSSIVGNPIISYHWTVEAHYSI